MPVDVGAVADQGMGQYTAREVSVMLQGNTSQYQEEMKQAGDSTMVLVKALETVEKIFKKVFGTIGKMAVGSGAVLTGMATSATWVAASFEDGFARVAKTTGLAGAELRNLGEEIRAISTDIPVSVGELSSLADLAGQLGAEDVAMFARVGASLGAATNIGAGQAVSALAGLVGQFNLTEDSVEGLASAFADLSNHTRASEGQILDFSDRVGGTAATIGMAADETLGWGAAIGAAGVQTEMGATAFSQTILKIQRAVSLGSEELSRFALATGYTREEFKKAWETSPSDVMMRFIKSLADQGDEASVTLQRLGLHGTGLSTTFLNLAQNAGSAEHALRLADKAASEGAKALNELAEVRFGTLLQALTVFRQSISEVMRSIGMVFLPAITLFVEAITWVVNLFNRMPQGMKSTIGLFIGLAGAILTVLGTVLLFITAFHGLIAAVALLPKGLMWLAAHMKALAVGAITPLKMKVVELALSFQLLSGGMLKASASSAVAGTSMLTLSGVVGKLGGALAKVIGLIVGKTGMYAFHEFGQALANVGKGGVLVLTKALWALWLPLLKITIAIGAVYALIKVGQWAFGNWGSEVQGASSAMEALAESADLAYTPLEGIASAAEGGAVSAKGFADANAELIKTLNALSAMDPEDYLQFLAMNLIMGGADPDEVQETIDRLADTITGFDGTVRIDFSLDSDGLARTQEFLESGLEGMMEEVTDTWRGSWGSAPSDEALEALDTMMENVKGWANQEHGFAAAIGQAFQIRGAIEQAFQDNEISRGQKRKMLNQWEQAMLEIFPAMEESFREGWNLRRWDVGSALNLDEFLGDFLGKTGQSDELIGPLKKGLEDLGHNLDDIGASDQNQLIQDLFTISTELMTANEVAGDLGRTLGVIEEKMEAAGGLDDQQTRRFRDAMIEAHVATVGHKQAIQDLQEHLEVIIETEDEWGTKADETRKAIKELGKEYADLKLKDVESMIQAGDAEKAVKALNRELRDIDMSMPGSQGLRDRFIEMRSNAIGQIESELRNLVQSRDQMLEQISETNTRTSERISEMQEQHLERMASMEEQHTERLQSIHERRDEALESASVSHQEKMKGLALQEQTALKRLSEQTADAYDPNRLLQSRPTASLGGLVANVEQQNEVLRTFAANLARLRDMGLSDDVVEGLGFDDPKNFAQVGRAMTEALADRSVIDDINATWKERLDVTKTLGDGGKGDEIREEYAENRRVATEEFQKQTAEINAEHKKSVQEQTTNFAEEQERVRQDFAKQTQKVNEDAAKQIGRIESEMQLLGQVTGDTLEELIQKGFDSNITGIQSMAEALRGAIESTMVDMVNMENKFRESGQDSWDRWYAPHNQKNPNPNQDSWDRWYAPQNQKKTMTPMYTGGVAMDELPALVAERGPEAVLPLNQAGADFVGNAIGPYLQKSFAGSMQHATPMTSTGSSLDTDRLVAAIQSSQQSGPSIQVGEVRAHDYHDFMEQMESKNRRERLSGMHKRNG